MLVPEVIERAEKRVGESIGGKWRLDRVIGVGGMAAVYEATHRNRNRVAIKLLHPALSLDEGTRHRFLREGYVANTIRHDGAVQVLDDDVTEDGVAFLVMELLRGESVEERMTRKGGALEIDEALSITIQLLDVLIAAHSQGVIHRDIKPDNLFLTEGGKLKVLDFGIARLHQGDTRETKVGSFMGTPAFCAPEQARGRWDDVDPRTDLFSVGANLFTCLTGAHVHEAETSSEQLALAISATPRSLAEALPGAPPDLVQLVDQSLSYNKDDRFQSARAMKAAVERVRAGLSEYGIVPLPISSAPPPGGATLGPQETQIMEPDPESMAPSPLHASRSSFRILVGLLAAGVLAVFLLIATQKNTGTRPAVTQELEVPGEQAVSADQSKTRPPAASTSAKDKNADPVVVPETSSSPSVEKPSFAKASEDARPKVQPVPTQAPVVKTTTTPQAAPLPRPDPPPAVYPKPTPPVTKPSTTATSPTATDDFFDNRH